MLQRSARIAECEFLRGVELLEQPHEPLEHQGVYQGLAPRAIVEEVRPVGVPHHVLDRVDDLVELLLAVRMVVAIVLRRVEPPEVFYTMLSAELSFAKLSAPL